jgi:hypothetical protein
MIETTTAPATATAVWRYRPLPGAGRPVRNGFTGYDESAAAALADAVGLQLVLLPSDGVEASGAR